MAAVISFSSEENWFINGWGWRTLLDRASQEAVGQPEAERLEISRHSHGLDFTQLDPSARARTAALLARAATALRAEYQAHGGTFEADYANALATLLPLLAAETGDNAGNEAANEVTDKTGDKATDDADAG